MLTKTTRVVELTGAGNRLITFSQWDEDDGDVTTKVVLRRESWVDLGRPGVITITVEPGDKLN